MLKLIITICLFVNFSLFAEIAQKLNISGNERVSDETIKVYGEISLNQNYTSFDVDKILKNLYGTSFFEDIKISLKDGVLNIIVKEYPVINSIDIRGEKSETVKKKLLERLSLKPKESFIENKLSDDIKELKRLYAGIGFNFSTAEAKIKRYEDNRVNIIYFIEKGKKTNIAEINFTGDKKIRDKRLRDVIASEEKKFWKFLSKNTFLSKSNIELDKRLLLNYYKSLGYYDVQVLSNNAEVSVDNFTTLTYTINAGNRYKVTKISTNVSNVLDKTIFTPLQKSFTKIVGKYYSPFIVKKLLDELDVLIASNDVQFVEHSVNEILENNTIEIKINIFEGKKLLVEKINIRGNNVTDEAVIRSELLLDEGDPFNSLKLDQSIARINGRNLFGEVKKTVTSGSSVDQKIIDIFVEEKPTGEISAGAGVGTNGASFAFNVSENNWLGKGLRINTSIDVGKETFSGGFSMSDPNYNFSGNTLTFHATNTTNDKKDSGYKNKIFSSGVGVVFEQYQDIHLSPSLIFSYDDLQLKSDASESLKKQKGKFTDLSFDYGITQDKRDRVYKPTDGYISGFKQAIPIYADSPYLKNTYTLSQYKAFSPNTIGKFKFFTSAINGLDDKDVRLSKRIKMPQSRLRGFESGKVGPKDGKDFVGGNYAWASNFELSLPNLLPESTKTDIGLFLDFGNLWNVDYDSSIKDSNKVRSSTGVNASWTSPIGPMTFILSQNISKASTDITEGFNFKLGTTF